MVTHAMKSIESSLHRIVNVTRGPQDSEDLWRHQTSDKNDSDRRKHRSTSKTDTNLRYRNSADTVFGPRESCSVSYY